MPTSTILTNYVALLPITDIIYNVAKINLHIHSNYSDGFHSIHKILEEADKLNFTYIAITDHNEIRGSLRAIEESKRHKVKIIPGIEIFFKYKNRITDLLVYFKKPNELIRFYNKFVGNKLLPIVNDPQELISLIRRYSGLIIQPHPMSLKGCMRNNFKVENNLEIKNPMAKEHAYQNIAREFGGADLHLYLGSLNCYTEVDGLNNIADLFENKKLKFTSINNFSISKPKKAFQVVVNIFLEIKYLTAQFILRKILKRGCLKLV